MLLLAARELLDTIENLTTLRAGLRPLLLVAFLRAGISSPTINSASTLTPRAWLSSAALLNGVASRYAPGRRCLSEPAQAQQSTQNVSWTSYRTSPQIALGTPGVSATLFIAGK